MIDKGVEEGVVEGIAFGMVLHAQAEGVVAEPHLLDHVVVRAPGLDFQAGTGLVQGLVMGAVDAGNLNGGAAGIAQELDVLELEFVVVRNVEMKRAAKRDIEHLQAPADGEEGQPLPDRPGHDREFPGIARGVGIFDQAGIGHRLAQEFAGDIAAAAEEQAVDAFGRRFNTRVPEAYAGIRTEDPLKGLRVALPNPCGDMFQPKSVTRKRDSRILLWGFELSLAKDLIRDDFDGMATPPFAYAFQPHEKIRDGFVRVLGEISARGRGLTHSREPADELIHEGRLLIKRARALLWFARPALGLAAYARARARLRKAAALLADQRDLAVTQATLEQLGKKAASPNARDRAALAQVFRSLVRNSAAGEAPEKALRHMLQKAVEILLQSVDGIKRSAAGRAAWPSPSGRLAEAFRAMRQAGKKARRTGKDADFHEWRKKAKRLLYQLELTQPGPGREMARTLKRVGQLQDNLGATHDGVVVEDRLRRTLPLSSSERRVLRLLEKRKARLRKKACKIARRLEASR